MALATPRFEILGSAGFGFGSGRVDRPQQFGADQTGEVEGTPHNVVHSGIGGLLGDPTTAALDPLFWLHHANIDRMWEVWLAQDDPQRRNPGDDVWLDTKFDFPDPAGRASYRVRDVLNTFEIGYVYDDVTPPPVEDRRRVVVPAPLEEAVEEPAEPELIGATDDAVPLAPGATHAVGLQPPDEWQLSKRAQAAGVLDERREVTTAVTELALDRRVLLQLERVTGTEVPYGLYGVYVNVPEGEDPSDYPNLKAGLFAPFGLELATAQGDGMTQSYDITEIARRLYDDGRWDPARVDVTFDAEVLKPGAEEETRRSGEPARGDVRVGSIRIYVE